MYSFTKQVTEEQKLAKKQETTGNAVKRYFVVLS